MRRRLITMLAGAAILAPAAPAAAQTLAARINAAPADATVRFSFEAKPGVCGNGENIRVRRADGDVSMLHGRNHYSRDGRRADLEPCEEGPVHVTLVRSGARITDADLRVGSSARNGAATDLGMVAAAAAVSYLHEAASGNAASSAADRMILASTLANAESWPGLLRLARDQGLTRAPRNTAIFWLAQAAGDRATAGLASVAGNDSDEIEVRKQAVFALSQIRSDDSLDALIRIARDHSEPELRRTAMFWLGQSGSPRAIAFFEDVLRGG